MSILISKIRINGFRGLQNTEVDLDLITVLTGMNNTGKTTFLKSLQIALGNRMFISQDDFGISDTEDQAMLKEKEKQEIEKLIDKINHNKYFQNLTNREQNQLLKNRPSRTMGWEKLIESSHLCTEYFLIIWKLYSNYSHYEMYGFSGLAIEDDPEKTFTLNRWLIVKHFAF